MKPGHGRRPPPPLPHYVVPGLSEWLDRTSHHYLGFGGAGDALLLLASCYKNKKAKVVFFTNEPHFAPQFFALFGIRTFVRPNNLRKPEQRRVYHKIRSMRNFKQSAHLPDYLRYHEWRDSPRKYQSRIVRYVPWRDDLGRIEHPKPTVVLCPSGSQRVPERQRYLSPDEYNRLTQAYLAKGFAVLTAASEENRGEYGLYPHPDCRWMTVDRIFDHSGQSQPCNLREMLRHVNGAQLVVSMDTWLKTYSLLTGIPTKVIGTRWHGEYRFENRDASDRIFLNRHLWPQLELCTLESLLG